MFEKYYLAKEDIMSQYCITKKRVNKVCIPDEYDLATIKIGVPVTGDEAEKVGLKRIGDVVLPAGKWGPQSKKNAYGYKFADKTKPKERRYVSTNWIHPFGNSNASEVPVDIYRECYPQVEVPANEIYLQLIEGEDQQQYVLVELSNEIRNMFLKEAVNLLLEIYGTCYIFDDKIKVGERVKREKCNWEMLPPGESLVSRIKQQIEKSKLRADGFYLFRIDYLERYRPERIVEGINGFKGYQAFLFNDYCILESAIYGNATYIIPKEGWEILSQKTKRQLLAENKVIKKIEHTAKWQENISCIFKELIMK